jgi:hypothetical protein
VYRKIIIHHYHPIHSPNIYTYFQVVGISRSSGGENSKAKWWGYRGQLVGELQGQVVGISRSSGGENYQGQVVGISRSSSGDIEVKWWGYQGQGEGLRGQGQKKVVGGACPLQLPLLSNLKQDDNLRPKKWATQCTIRQKKAVCSGFFFLLAADNLVADPLTRVRSWRVPRTTSKFVQRRKRRRHSAREHSSTAFTTKVGFPGNVGYTGRSSTRVVSAKTSTDHQRSDSNRR